MTAAKKAKAKGLITLKQVSDMIGRSTQTLYNWEKNYAALYDVLLAGCKAMMTTKKSKKLRIKTYTDSKKFMNMTITHEPTGISVSGRGITHAALKKNLMKELEKMGYTP